MPLHGQSWGYYASPYRTPLISDRPKHASLLECVCLKFVERDALPYQMNGDRSRFIPLPQTSHMRSCGGTQPSMYVLDSIHMLTR